MYFRVDSRKNELKHNSNGKLMLGLSIGQRRALLFYSNGKFFDYNMLQEKIIFSRSLGQRPLSGVATHHDRVICMLADSRRLVSIDLSKREVAEICKLPTQPTGDQQRDRNTFFMSQLHSFRQSGTFYIEQSNEDDSKRRITYFSDPQNLKQKRCVREFQNNNFIFQPIDQVGRLAIYKQHGQVDKKWEFRIVDLNSNQEILFDRLRPLPVGCLVEQVWAKSPEQILIFINGPTPEVWLVDVKQQKCQDSPIKLAVNFRNVFFYNPDNQIGCLSYLSNTKHNQQLYENMIELVDFKTGTVMNRSYATLKDLSVGWQDDYILDIAAQNRTGNTSFFHTRHLIRKKSLYYHMMTKTGILEKYGKRIKEAINLLD